MLIMEKIKSNITRALAITLAISIGLSPVSTIPVYAGSVNDNNNGGGGGGNMGTTSKVSSHKTISFI